MISEKPSFRRRECERRELVAEPLANRAAMVENAATWVDAGMVNEGANTSSSSVRLINASLGQSRTAAALLMTPAKLPTMTAFTSGIRVRI